MKAKLSEAYLLDYFAAHAPEVPTWFEKKKDVYEMRPVNAPKPHIPEWTEMRNVCVERESDLQHMIRWRWFYAKTMVAERKDAP